jgi:hypothetical protein
MQKCITCGTELHPERAKKYDYCMSRECQEKNVKGLTMVAVGVNKAAEQYLILDDDTKEEIASGRYHDQRRGSFGTSPASPGASAVTGAGTAVRQARHKPAKPAKPAQPAKRPVPRKPWTGAQERLALLYNEQGIAPPEIAQKLGLSTYAVTQIILSSRNRGKL